MIHNVGLIDRILRGILGFFLLAYGLFQFNGIEGNLWGIAIALTSILPFYMAITSSCFVFRWMSIHSLSKAECAKHGHPYRK